MLVMNSIVSIYIEIFENAKKEEGLFSEELSQSGTVQGLVSWITGRYQS